MKKLIILLLFLTSCTPQIEEEIIEEVVEETVEIEFYEPVENNQANTEFMPYFEGQTRTNGIRTETEYSITLISEGLETPWGIDVLPNGIFVITEKFGTIRLFENGTLSDKIFVTNEIETSGQGGLLDVLVSPDFESSGLIYFTLAEKTNQGSLTAVAKAQLSLDTKTISNFEIIYRATPYFSGNNHYGSRIVLDNDGNLFVSTGDRQSLETRPNAQTLDNGHGKILHIDTDGNALSNNPFYTDSNAHNEIFSIGHRNIQGIAIHPLTGELWANEMGPQGGDELNRIESGKNYGWPIISYGEEYSGSPIGNGISFKEGLEQPVYYWDPVIAPAGMIFYNSDVIKEWENNLFIGGLKGQHIARLLIKDNKVIGEERIVESEGQRFRDITVGLDGALYTITDSGRLYRIGK
ncbi:MAG: PQQ-dependent sugar dehydrogenase [Erysipelotrichaceae bacterium]|nr:PQQ-dependent sugar dehydrogenase [Erysipelotrichaceae bacterium]